MAERENVSVENGMDVVLVLLYAGGSKENKNEVIIGNTRLDKLVFLIEKETDLKKYLHNFTFEAYNYGPYSSELFDSVQALVNAGLVKAETSNTHEYLDEADRYQVEQQLEDSSETSKSTAVYSLTCDGEIVASELFNSLTQAEQSQISMIKKMFNSINLKRLLHYIYQKYPDSAVNSLIKDKIC